MYIYTYVYIYVHNVTCIIYQIISVYRYQIDQPGPTRAFFFITLAFMAVAFADFMAFITVFIGSAIVAMKITARCCNKANKTAAAKIGARAAGFKKWGGLGVLGT